MLFGIPWYAIIPIVAILGGLLYAYKERELEMEEKIQVKAREVRELEKVVHNLKSRVEALEADRTKKSRSASTGSRPEIEINDELEDQNSDNDSQSQRNRTKS